MKQPDRLTCLFRGWDEACQWPQCPDHIAAHPTDPRRRRPTCAVAVGDVARLAGGLSERDVAWLSGTPLGSVNAITKRALAKMRAGAGEGWR